MPHAALIERVKTELRVQRKAEARYADVLAPDFDPFDFFARQEMRLSKVVAWMLDPEGSHAQGTTYLRLFLEQCVLTSFGDTEDLGTLKRTSVRVERPVYFANQSLGRIDIEVSNDKILLLIENKPDGSFGETQLERYRKVVQSDGRSISRLVVLRGWGEHEATDREAGDIALQLGTEVAAWVEGCARQTKAPDVRSFLERLRQHLMRRFGGIGGEKELASVLSMIGDSPESIQVAMEIASALPSLKTKIMSEFYARCDDAFRHSGLTLVDNVAGEPRLPNKFGMLRVSIGEPEINFAISCDRSDLNDSLFGICLRKANRSFKKLFVTEREAFSRAWGAGAGGDGNEWWIWWDALPNLVPDYAAYGQAGLWASFADHGPKGMLTAALAKAVEASELLA